MIQAALFVVSLFRIYTVLLNSMCRVSLCVEFDAQVEAYQWRL